jgi:hypothetical protein
MGRRIGVEANDVLEHVGKSRIVRQFERPDAMRGELVGLKDALHRPQTYVRRLRQHPGLRVLSRTSPSTPSAMNRACHHHTTGFDLPDRRMISAVVSFVSVTQQFNTTT